MPEPAVELEGITKRFPGVIANDNVTMTVADGEIHAICGENGAGKSTLMKILYGMQPADEGVMKVHGREVRFGSPRDAIEAGIGMVHQHFMLADQLTVLENIILGAEPGGPIIDFDTARTHIRELGASYGLHIDPDTLIEDLQVGERQRVEIIKVLYRGADVLILDEPTAVLVPDEVDVLFRNLRDLKAQGKTIIFIDHKLQEVLEISDTITVIRRGRTVTTVDAADVDAHDLAELMVGSELPTPETTDSTVTDTVMARVDGVTVVDEFDRPTLIDASLSVHTGEIVGVAGVEGNGQAELVGAILGTVPMMTGTIEVDGTDVTQWGVRPRREHGMGYVPADRQREGLLLESPLWENAALGHQTSAPYSRGIWIDRDGSRERTQAIREEFDVRSPNVDVSANALSGGNQQKLIIGRELAAKPKLLVASHPTRGIDVGAQAAVWEQMRAARAEGLAVLLISADLDELIGLSDRLVVILGGRLVAELDPSSVTARELGAYMTGAASAEQGTRT